MSERKNYKKKKEHPKRAPEKDASLSSIFSTSLRGALFAIAVSILLGIVFCFIAYRTGDPSALLFPLSLSALYVGAFLAGFICRRKVGHSFFVCGLISGGILMALIIFISFFFPHSLSSSHSFGISFLLHSLIVIFSILGGYMGQKKPKRNHKPKR